jgi:cbb3-type cytochrome oxidase maturation protein
MSNLIYLIPIALFLGALGLGAFLWTMKSGQYEDLDGAAWRVLDDGDDKPKVGLTFPSLGPDPIPCSKTVVTRPDTVS